MKYDLLTKYSKDANNLDVLKDYPRPNLKRDSYYNLNGIWGCETNQTGDIPEKFNEKIVVPFPVESYLSSVRKELKKGEYLFYYKEFILDKDFLKEITLLHFEAVDQICEVYLNNALLGINEGGYIPFTFDITSLLNIGNNTLIVKVKDETSVDYPYGKQAKNRGGMWYTPVSGIWGSVWLESVNRNYIRDIKITPDIDKEIIKLEIDTLSDSVEIEIKENDTVIYKENTDKKQVIIPIKKAKLWSPENPFLYDLYIKTNDDYIKSYFGMRKFHVDEKYFYLNNKPYFINGVLDQGYFSDGIYTPSSYEAYKDDILSTKKLGFNTLRKHIKIEPKIFYYYCDSYGMLVFQDMVNLGKYNFMKHTALPGIGIQKMIGKSVTSMQKNNFIKQSKQTLAYLHNFPSIVCYTIFNEGWGQFEADKLYEMVKSIDNTRVVDTTSGWFKSTLSDVNSLHVYFKKIKLKKSEKPIFVSEFGGYSYKIKEHSFNLNRTFGYRKYTKQNKFEEAFIQLYKEEILGNIKNNLAGAIYTQLSDVEDETNGLITYDRKVCKVNAEKVMKIMNQIIEEFNKRNEG